MISQVSRPVMRYHGGKWMLAPWIISHFPPHRIYVEPFCGAASVLLRKPRAYAEVINDVDGEIVNVFRVLRNSPDELRRRIELTPSARDEYRESFEVSEDPVEQARRTITRSFLGFGSNSLNRGVASGFRANSNRSGTTPAQDWRHWPENVPQYVERLRGVIIENRAAVAVMVAHDSPETLHYCDPPYVHKTRMNDAVRKGYAHEMSDIQHREMAEVLKSLKGRVVLSGYACDLYDVELFAEWNRVERPSLANGARERTEVLWMNFSSGHGELFSE